MNKLFKMLQESFSEAPQRNGFDLSRRDIFSSKVGYLHPCFCLETVPNDYHEIKPVNMIRTMPFNEANFVRMKQHMNFYYVPFKAFMSNFDEYIQQTVDPVNSLLVGSDVPTRFPTFPLDELLFAIAYTHWCMVNNTKEVPASAFAEQFLDLTLQTEWLPQLVFTDMFFAQRSVVESENYLSVNMFYHPIHMDAVRLMDMLGYGNYLQLIPKTADEYTQGNWATFFNNLIYSVKGKRINLFRFAAYQCVYQNFGINTVYDKLNVFSYNFDDVLLHQIGSDDAGWLHRYQANSYDPYRKINCIFEMHFAQWKKDIFTAAYPDSQFGGVSVVSVNHVVGDTIGTLSSSSARVVGVRVDNGDSIALSRSSNNTAYQLSSQFSILDLRRAEALQGWKEDMMRSGFRAKSRQKSQFGVSPAFDPHCTPYILGSVSSDIQKDVVTGTAGQEFAQLAANGISTMGNQEIKFDGAGRNDFGIIIGTLAIVPEADYDSFGLDIHNMKSEPFDWYTPAFQNIGLQSMPAHYLNTLFTAEQGDSGESLPAILGFVPRYAEYKQAYDKVHGEFCSFKYGNGDVIVQNGEFRQFVSTRVDMERYGLSKLASLYVNPAIVANIFLDMSSDAYQSSDQFMINCYFDVKSVRPMSVLGLPRW